MSRCNSSGPIKLHHYLALTAPQNECDLGVMLEKSLRILPDPERNLVYDVWYHQDIVPKLQVGPMCGLVALSIATKIEVLTLLSEAKSMKMTSYGEMFSANWMCELVNQSQSVNKSFVATVLPTQDNLTWTKLKQYFAKKCFFLVAYDLSEDMRIGFRRGQKAHWVLLVGLMSARGTTGNESARNPTCVVSENVNFSTTGPQTLNPEISEGPNYVLGFHGKSRRMCIYDLKELIRSNEQLFEPGNFVDDSYMVPVEGLEKHLCGKIVLLTPNQS